MVELKRMDYVSLAKFDQLKRHSFRRGDIVMTKLGNPLGVSAIVEGIDDGVIVADLVRIRAQRINTKYLCYHLNSQQTSDYINSMQKGTTRPRITLSVVRELPVAVPPLSEQQRIVGILDKAFDGIATAKTNAEKNLLNARELFESHLQAVFTQHGEGWAEKTLEEVAAVNCTLSYGIVQPGDEYPNGLPVVRPTDLTTRVIRLSGLKRINPKLADGYRRTALLGGELLLCVRGSTGVVSVASAELVGANVTRGIVPIRFDGALLTPDFGFYLMSSGDVQSQIREKTYGAALMQINIRDLRNIALAFPPRKEQEGISANLDELHEETQRLESIYRQKLAAVDELKKSLLDQAFTGKL